MQGRVRTRLRECPGRPGWVVHPEGEHRMSLTTNSHAIHWHSVPPALPGRVDEQIQNEALGALSHADAGSVIMAHQAALRLCSLDEVDPVPQRVAARREWGIDLTDMPNLVRRGLRRGGIADPIGVENKRSMRHPHMTGVARVLTELSRNPACIEQFHQLLIAAADPVRSPHGTAPHASNTPCDCDWSHTSPIAGWHQIAVPQVLAAKMVLRGYRVILLLPEPCESTSAFYGGGWDEYLADVPVVTHAEYLNALSTHVRDAFHLRPQNLSVGDRHRLRAVVHALTCQMAQTERRRLKHTVWSLLTGKVPTCHCVYC
jgi:hypothetical protein